MTSDRQGDGGGQAPARWRERRERDFLKWRRDHAISDAAIDALKLGSRELLEGYRRAAEDRMDAARRERLARELALSDAERERIRAALAEGIERVKANDFAAARSLLEPALILSDMRAEAAYQLGLCYRAEGDAIKAADHMAIAAAIKGPPGHANSADMRAMLAMQLLPAPSDPDIDAPTALFRVPGAPTEIWDMAEAPHMIVVPAGAFTMGSPPDEPNHQPSERQHRVTFAYPLAWARAAITRAEFAAFVEDTGHDAKGADGSYVQRGADFHRDPDADWRTPGFEQTDDDPVVCINFHDAEAYADWLSRKTGRRYRLPSEAEWEYAARGGSSTLYPWGTEITGGHANCDGCGGKPEGAFTTPGGTFPPNGFGLYDMVGNVWQWVADYWNPTYEGAPRDGSAWMTGNSLLRGRKGGSWFNVAQARPGDVRAPYRLRSAARFGSLPHLRYSSFGFRVVREL